MTPTETGIALALPPPIPKRRKHVKLEDGTEVCNSAELQRVEPVRSMAPKPSTNALGRPAIYSDEIADRICSYLSQGKTLVEISELDPSLPDHATIRKWAFDNYRDFFHKYTQARELGLDAMAEQLFAIADDGSNDWIEKVAKSGETFTVPDHEHMARSRLRIETRKWYLSKLAPKKYGERVEIVSTQSAADSVGALLASICSPPELADLQRRLLAYQAQKALAAGGEPEQAQVLESVDIMVSDEEKKE